MLVVGSGNRAVVLSCCRSRHLEVFWKLTSQSSEYALHPTGTPSYSVCWATTARPHNCTTARKHENTARKARLHERAKRAYFQLLRYRSNPSAKSVVPEFTPYRAGVKSLVLVKRMVNT